LGSRYINFVDSAVEAHQRITHPTAAERLVGRNSKKKRERRIIMPVFGSPFSGLVNKRKLTKEELIRTIRFAVASEIEAAQVYMQIAESIDNKLAGKVLKDVADEERVHIGEFLRLLSELAPDEEKFYANGAKEVEAIIEKMK
jgi:demethoxyubiquinone hydroxylase (CLK1/Coq7/Cat5 family)